MTRLLAIGLLVLALAGCGSDSNGNEAASPEPTAPPPMSTTATTASCQPQSGAGLTPGKSSANENRQTMYLTDVSVEAKTCGDRVVFGFEEQEPGPGYEVSYQPASTAKIEDGSGNPIDVAGEAFLVVKLMPAMTAKIDGDQVTKTYTGPRRVSGVAPVEEVVKTGDFEGVVTWVIGLDQKRPFATSASDKELVVGIDHVLP